MGGQQNCPLVAIRIAHWWPVGCPVQLVRGITPWPPVACVRRIESPVVMTMWAWCKSLSTVALAMVFGMSSSKPPGGVQVRRDRHGAFLVGGVDGAVEGFGGVGGDREQSDVINADEVGAHQSFDGSAGGAVGAVAVDELAECFEGEPLHVAAVVDGGVTERFDEV